MLWTLFFMLYGDIFLALFGALSLSMSGQMDSDDLTFFKEAKSMFPENFLSRYPHEANADRLKIIGYLIFNLLVKGYGSVDPSRIWASYNRDGCNRVVIDAVFHEYFSNFADGEAKDLKFNPLENFGTEFTKLASKEELAVDRIGEYLDLLSETEQNMGTEPEREIKGAYDPIAANESPTIYERRPTRCEMLAVIETSGVPAKDYPNFCDIPKTSFTCLGKRVPGIYADYETGCQVFHVCWPHRIDSFLCPIGTIFNQSLLTCDIWHETGCFSSPLFHRDHFLIDGISTERDIPKFDGTCESLLNKPLRLHTKFLPAKCEMRDVFGKKIKTKLLGIDPVELKERSEMAYNLIKEMLQMLRKLRSDLDIEMKDGETPNVLAKHLKSIPKLSTKTVEEVAEFTKKLGETSFKLPKVPRRERLPEKFAPGMQPDISVTRSALIMPSESSGDHIKSSEDRDVPKTVMKSLELDDSVLYEDVIPLARQVMMDSYRRIESKKY